MTFVEADKGGIIVTGDCAADVYAETQYILSRCGEVYISFLVPVKQADGKFVSKGNVILGGDDMMARSERKLSDKAIGADDRTRVHGLWQERLAKDDWAGWRAMMSLEMIEGQRVPVDPNTPFTGYYRSKRKDKTFAPVAYWKENGKWCCLIDGQPVDETKALDQWPFIARYPISLEWYTAVAEEGKPWPDADARVSSEALAETKPSREIIGGNNPPQEDALTSIKNKIENAKGGVDDYKTIKDDEALAKAKSLKNRLTELAGEADKTRKAEKEPHKIAADAVDELWMPVVKDAQAAAKTINAAMDAWETEKLQARRKVEQEAAAAQAAADRIAADNARKLREAEAAGAPAPELAPVPEVKPVAAPPIENTTVRAGYGRAGSVKTEWVVTKITDVDALFVLLKTHPELRELMLKLAQRAKNAGIDPPGVEMEERAKVRG